MLELIFRTIICTSSIRTIVSQIQDHSKRLLYDWTNLAQVYTLISRSSELFLTDPNSNWHSFIKVVLSIRNVPHRSTEHTHINQPDGLNAPCNVHGYLLSFRVVDGVLAVGLYYRGIRDVHPRDHQHYIRVQVPGRDQISYCHRTGMVRTHSHLGYTHTRSETKPLNMCVWGPLKTQKRYPVTKQVCLESIHSNRKT